MARSSSRGALGSCTERRKALPQRASRAHEAGEAGQKRDLSEKLDDPLLCLRAEVVAHAHRPEQQPIARAAHHEFGDRPPQQQQGGIGLLVLGPDERSPALETGNEARDQLAAVREQRRGVQPVHAEARHDGIGGAAAIRADDLTALVVPQHQVQVMRVEPVEIDAPARSFSDRAERELAQAADLVEQVGNRVGAGDENPQRSAAREHRLGTQRVNFATQRNGIRRWSDGLGRHRR
jgi:hypothetical protein